MVSSPGEDGRSILSGRAQPDSNVFARNLRTNTIAGERTREDSGRYEFGIEAQAGDILLFWYTAGTEQSSGLYLEVPSQDEEPRGLAGAPSE